MKKKRTVSITEARVSDTMAYGIGVVSGFALFTNWYVVGAAIILYALIMCAWNALER